MNYELVMLVSRLRKVERLEDLGEVKGLAESMMRKAKNEAILTLMTVAEELGDQEVLGSVDELKRYLKTVLKAGDEKNERKCNRN